MTILTLEIRMNGTVLRAHVTSAQSAKAWIVETLQAVLAERELQVNDQLEIRRTS